MAAATFLNAVTCPSQIPASFRPGQVKRYAAGSVQPSWQQNSVSVVMVPPWNLLHKLLNRWTSDDYGFSAAQLLNILAKTFYLR